MFFCKHFVNSCFLTDVLIMSRLDQILKKRKKFAIAFSGGVDSTFLAAAAKNICKDKVIVITADSAFQSKKDIEKASEIAASLNIPHFVIKVDVMSSLDITQNSKQRCYFCKKKLFSAIKEKSLELGFDTLAHGANIDDLKDYRPGLKAAQEMNIFSPLVEAQMTKSQIRLESKNMGLATWNIPSQSCLATRIPYNEIITVEKLRQIEACEEFLNQLGFYGIRVRCHTYTAENSNKSEIDNSYTARIECSSEDISLIAAEKLRDKITSFFTAQGFRFISLDLKGYCSGNMN